MTAPKAPQPYVSPLQWAREVLSSGGEQNFPGKVRAAAVHIVQLSAMISADLEAEEAPVHVFRWVAWAKGATAQRRRADLVLHLRRALERARNGWLEERHLTAALAMWDAATEGARSRGLIAPRPEGLPVEQYREAILAARKRARASEALAESPEAPPVRPERAEAPAEGARATVLQHLSNGLVAAAGAGDLEAARAANEAISKLLAVG
jgi:hypothetical protein